MKKLWKKLVLLILVVLVLAFIGFRYYLSSAVTSTIEKMGAQMTGAPVKAGRFSLSLLTGQAELRDFELGNPEGYNTDHAIKFKSVKVDLDVGSLLSDTVVISEIRIDAPEVTWEGGLGESNLSKIQENIKAYTESKEESSEPQGDDQNADQDSGKKVVIKKVIVGSGYVNLSVKLLQGAAAPVPFSETIKENIGEEEDEGGVSIGGAVDSFFTFFFFGLIFDVVKGAFDVLGIAAEGIGKGVESSVKAGAEGLADGIRKIFD